MVLAEQLTIDFDAPPDPEQELQRRWAENERRESERWNEEALCIVWACGFEDRDWWNSLPKYQQNSWLQRYLWEQEAADISNRRMLSARHVLSAEEEHYQDRKRLAESWAADIRQAFLEGRRCPIKPEPEFQYVLQWAFELAQVPAACLGTAETESEVRARA